MSYDDKKKPFQGPVLDKVGNEIVPGSIIAYGHALGRCAALQIGRVIAIKAWLEERHYGDEPIYRITVHGIEDGWAYRKEGPKLLSKRSTLQFADRCLVIPRPNNAYGLLLDSVDMSLKKDKNGP